MRRSNWMPQLRRACGLLAASALLVGTWSAWALGSAQSPKSNSRTQVATQAAAAPSPQNGPDGASVSLFDYTVTGTQRAKDDRQWNSSNYTKLGQANIGYGSSDRNDNAFFNQKPEWFEEGINGGGCHEKKCQADTSTMKGGHLLKFFHMGEQDSHSTRNIADAYKVDNPLYHYLWSRNNATNPDPSGSLHLGHPNDKEYDTIGYANVQPKLSNAGVPVVIDPDHPQYSESLVYLFDPSWSWTPGRVWQKTGLRANLLSHGSDDYWSYDSNQQWAQYDGHSGFTVTQNNGDPHQASSGKFFAPFDAIGTREADIDHYFGMRLDQPFRVNSDGLSNDGQPIRFDFSGDDDVWVAIDGVVLLNMSGQLMYHRGSINITDGTIQSADYNRNAVLNRVSTTFAERQKAAGIQKGVSVRGGLTAGMHTLSLFYLERGNGGSNLSVRYNLPTPKSIRHGYQLSLSTQAHGPKSLVAGSKDPVKDSITSTFESGYHEKENLRGKVILHWDGSPAAQAEKTVSLPTGSTKDSPQFTPQDFSWKEWKPGKYWFDIHLEKQAHLTQAVDTPDREPAESWTLAQKPTPPEVQITASKTWAINSKLDGSGSWSAVADHSSFHDGEPLAAVVNGVIPAHLSTSPTVTISDDWSQTSYAWQPDDISSAKVMTAELPNSSQQTRLAPTLDLLTSHGQDVTSSFRLTLDHSQHRIEAQLRPDAADHYAHLSRARQLTLLVPGHIRIANGRGITQIQHDYPHQSSPRICLWPGGESSGGQHPFSNQASEMLNGQRTETNRPVICLITPRIHKSVQATDKDGTHARDIDGKSVQPGQSVHYVLSAHDMIPQPSHGNDIKKLQFVDSYDPHVRIDTSSIRVMTGSKNTGGTNLNPTDYTVTNVVAKHQLTVALKPSALAALALHASEDQEFAVEFDAHLLQDIPAITIRNTFEYGVNNSQTSSNEVTNPYNPPSPSKQVTKSGHPDQSINGKTLVDGDQFDYVLHLDASEFSPTVSSGAGAVSAYPLRRIGIIDRLDQRLKVSHTAITVRDENGNDQTSRFTISTEGGVVRVFATTDDITQTSPLTTYVSTPSSQLSSQVDASLLGHRYSVTIPVTLNCGKSYAMLNNTAEQIVDDQNYVTNQVSNSVAVLQPHKSVLDTVDGKDLNGSSLDLGTTFVYRLDSSTLPAHRADTTLASWELTDQIPQEDHFTGVWEVRAARPLMINGKSFNTGQVIASNSKPNSNLFNVNHGSSQIVTIHAGAQTLASFSRDSEQPINWTVYIQCRRMKPSQHVSNQLNENMNSRTRRSNTVWTSTSQPPVSQLPLTGAAIPLTPLFIILCFAGGTLLAFAAFQIRVHENDGINQ